MPPAASVYERIYAAVRSIPAGRVATYGQIARMVGRCTPRMVGYAMAALPDGTDVPWHRVVNREGRVSVRSRGDGARRQRMALEAEGVRFGPGGRLDWGEVAWEGPRGGAAW